MLLLDLGLILILGFTVGLIFEKIKIPKIVGMIVIGILIGPSFLNLISPNMLGISSYLRNIALVIILTRSGLSIDYKKLKEAGLVAILMCFIPATFEIVGVMIFGPMLLGISLLEAVLLGSVLGAVSPAIVVPRMIKIKEEGYGRDKGISEIILTGASLDDIYTIVLFYAFLALNQTGNFDLLSLMNIPLQILLGLLIGLLLGYLLSIIYKKVNFNLTVKVLILFGVSLALVGFESVIENYIKYSGLVSIISMGIMILIQNKEEAEKIENVYKNMWTFFEIILFVLVGIAIDFKASVDFGFKPILVILLALVIRMIGVYICVLFSKLNQKERMFIMLSYIAKATVQASIGPIVLSVGLSVGPLILTTAVISIMISAPLGAYAIDLSYKKLLKKEKELQ
ncbi:cation:proton antiporter [Acholeplasma hippikon]|uniref:Potassium/proton antiporter n=1 Tax=Acholeplasma hippikon TaxID=264636 RepID=A0A449BHU2_9MOLU|nr:cation:proton antiporter [Acholeplasma hippikon]VEU82018.1 potassium/proton antiporter [Acholeplasma hippikon]